MDGRPVKEYVGGGLAGELAAEADRIERERREAEDLRRRRVLERLEVLAAPLEELDDLAATLTRTSRVAGGYHRRKGEWRMRRDA